MPVSIQVPKTPKVRHLEPTCITSLWKPFGSTGRIGPGPQDSHALPYCLEGAQTKEAYTVAGEGL